MIDACANRATFGDGVLTTVLFGIPLITAFLYAILRGVTPAGRAERAYGRDLGRRAAEYMRLGVSPRDSWDEARRDMAREAKEALSA